MNLASLLGIKIQVYGGTDSKSVLNRPLRYHKKSRRWYKKFYKRYGSHRISWYIIPNGKINRIYGRFDSILIMNPRTYQQVINHPQMKQYKLEDQILCV